MLTWVIIWVMEHTKLSWKPCTLCWGWIPSFQYLCQNNSSVNWSVPKVKTDCFFFCSGEMNMIGGYLGRSNLINWISCVCGWEASEGSYMCTVCPPDEYPNRHVKRGGWWHHMLCTYVSMWGACVDRPQRGLEHLPVWPPGEKEPHFWGT